MSSLEQERKEKLVHALYEICGNRSLTSAQVFEKLVTKLDLIGTSHLAEKATEIIRPYKQTGKNLEETTNKLYNLLYPNGLELDSNTFNKTTWG